MLVHETGSQGGLRRRYVAVATCLVNSWSDYLLIEKYRSLCAEAADNKSLRYRGTTMLKLQETDPLYNERHVPLSLFSLSQIDVPPASPSVQMHLLSYSALRLLALSTQHSIA